MAEGQAQTIKHGKVTITVTPKTPTGPVRSVRVRDTQHKCKTLFESGSANCLCGSGQFCFDRIGTPHYEQSDEIFFDVIIKTDISKPVRLGDSVIAFRTGGNQIPFEDYQDSYTSFRKLVILPGSTFRFPGLQGPRTLLRNIKAGEKVNIVLGFYDIPVNMNDNSVVTKKAQFEYKFNYSYTEEQKAEPLEVEHMHTVKRL